MREACAACGIGVSTHYDWMQQIPEYSDAIKKAVSECARVRREGAVACIMRTIEGGTWQAAAWWLERNYPQRYALRNRVELTGRNGGPLKHTGPTIEDRLGRPLTDKEIAAMRAHAESEVSEMLASIGMLNEK